jgi:hypothetical protein
MTLKSLPKKTSVREKTKEDESRVTTPPKNKREVGGIPSTQQ